MRSLCIIMIIHEKAGKAKNTYEGSPGVATFSLGRPSNVQPDDGADDDLSAISDLTKDESVTMVKELKMSRNEITQTKGSPPDTSNTKASDMASRDKAAKTAADSGKDSISVSSSSSSDSSSSGSGSVGSGTTKAGGKSTTSQGGSEMSSPAPEGE